MVSGQGHLLHQPVSLAVASGINVKVEETQLKIILGPPYILCRTRMPTQTTHTLK